MLLEAFFRIDVFYGTFKSLTICFTTIQMHCFLHGIIFS